ncbi:methyltransferase domain-containing protein [Ginsengibacter hankyongi]|uniref:Methyltransferase domain-containing protein n=1 Tax=Ginsengibacter hankyongi TaxID=2607284 RepID=A0A5J5IFR7_9BACT|nr:methyltransferase domain-containing protein [Ginsengibacter hankyongi]KAA9036386.1 methyltransferase domain-containing protein [Ginsengibacter hankyongi]
MDFAFCTIITSDYIHYALALHKSLLDFGKNVKLYILISDRKEIVRTKIEEKYPGIFILYSEDLCNSGLGKNIYDKYHDTDITAFRWSMKPVLINYLLEVKDYQKVIYLDADIYFYNDYNFLLNELDSYDILLTPHWRSRDPHTDLINFRSLYKEGIFNGGFIGVNKKGIAAMDWFAKVCEFICINDPSQVMYYDQLHLNMLPVYFDKVGIIKHKGCNVANWNMIECKRLLDIDKKTVLIANEYPVVFIHFSTSTVNGIINGEDPLLLPYLDQYYLALNQYSSEIELMGIELPGMENSKTSNNKPVKVIIESVRAEHQKSLSKEFTLDYYSNIAILNAMKRFSNYFKGNLLNMGPGDENRKAHILQNCWVTGFNELDVEKAWQFNASTKSKTLWSGIQIPYGDNLFDTVLGVDILQNCARPEIFFKEANRVMTQKGVFFFTIPYLYPLDESDKNRYTIFSLKRQLQEAGFVNTDISATGGWHASMAQMLALWVTRSSISDKRKKILSAILKPLIKYLVKLEKYTKVDLDKRPMVTGLCGVAFKP